MAKQDTTIDKPVHKQSWSPHSLEADWDAAMFMPFSAERVLGEFTGMEPWQAQAQLMAIEMIETWLAAGRTVTEAWEAAIRDRQDAFLAGWRDQVGRATYKARHPRAKAI